MLESLNIKDIVGTREVVGSQNWSILSCLFNGRYSTISFTLEEENWVIRETFETEIVFELQRNILTMNRKTVLDKYGLLGLSLINDKDKSVTLTEGVSDFVTAKLCFPDKNVLGVTTLGGSRLAKSILVNCFDDFTFIADNDNTGIKNVFKWKQLLTNFGKEVKIQQPEPSFKDITDEFVFDLKLYLNG